MTPEPCPLCTMAAEASSPVGEIPQWLVRCARCGEFTISTPGTAETQKAQNAGLSYILSGYTRRAFENGAKLHLSPIMVRDLLERHSKVSVLGSYNLLLRYIGDKTPSLSGWVNLSPSRDYPVAFLKTGEDFLHMLRMLIDRKMIAAASPPMNASKEVEVQPTLEGWTRIEELSTIDNTISQGFVAMMFHESVGHIYDQAIRPAITQAGYDALRIDRMEHNDRIDDLILLEIQRSRFLVADLTGHRQGVYWEAGYAMGLGIPVIWTCRKDDGGSTPFDIRQYNRIEWESDDLASFRERLKNRIKATVPVLRRVRGTGG